MFYDLYYCLCFCVFGVAFFLRCLCNEKFGLLDYTEADFLDLGHLRSIVVGSENLFALCCITFSAIAASRLLKYVPVSLIAGVGVFFVWLTVALVLLFCISQIDDIIEWVLTRRSYVER